ncbi:GTP-binding protein [Candidatus Woesearchaeota archaeon]|nr:MAG: GTP-binding protein [Candidatus Woesearchaeota archaeon]
MSKEAEKIKEIEKQLAKARYNKATEKWFGLMKSRIAQLKRKQEERKAKKGKGEGFFVKKSGDATVIMMGFPSVGKSTLLNALTGAKSKTGAYEFTTLKVIPGVMHYNQAKIQILDVPGIISGAAAGKGRGKEVLAMGRNADLILITIDAQHPEHYKALLKEIYDSNIRINQKKPNIKITKKEKGGISISSITKQKLSKETFIEILKNYKIANADVVLRETVNIDQFIDVIENNRKYIPAIVVITKTDLIDTKTLEKLKKEFKEAAFISAETGKGIKELKEKIFETLNFARIYLKEINKKPDLEEPMVLKKPVTLKTVCEHIHRDFVKKFKYARVWGKSAKFPGQDFRKLDKELEDGDIVEIHLV